MSFATVPRNLSAMKRDSLVQMLAGLSRRLSESRGATAVEFALIAPLLFLFLLGLIDFGLGFEAKMAVSQAAQAGSYYALLNGFDQTAITNAVTNATDTSGISASPSPTESCGCPSGTAVTASPCNSTCPNGQSPGTYATVSAQYQYSTILPYPGLSSPMTLVSTSMVRIK